MESKSIRSFAGGLIVAAIFLGSVYFMGADEVSGKDTKEAPKQVTDSSVDDMVSKLIDEGYVVQTKEEWNKELSVAKEEAKANKPKEEAEVNKPKEEAAENVVYRTVISVTTGMTSIDVGKALQQTNIIDSGFAFSQEVEKRGLSNQLKPGMFEVQSGMSIDEIISTIFK